MNKAQCYIESILCVAMALIFSYPLAKFTPPLVAVIYGCVLIAFGAIFFLIGVNK